MKMTSDIGNGDAASTKKEVSDCDSAAMPTKTDTVSATVASPNRDSKNRLTFSIDSLVGKNSKDRADRCPSAAEKPTMESSKGPKNGQDQSRSPSPSAKRHCSQVVQQPTQAKPPMLSKTPPANGSSFPTMADQNQQRLLRQSAFMPPSITSAPSGLGFAPVPLSGPVAGNRLCWDLMPAEPNAGLWKDAVTASAMYQAAAAAALCTGYHPWYGPAAPMAPSEMAKKQQLLLQQDQQSMALMASPQESIARSDPRHHHGQQNHSQAAGMAPSADQQSQTFWHHHIAELLRQNGGHPVHHSRLYAGPDAGHAAAGFLFSGCRKPKRIRTAFSPNQLMELEAAFEKNQYVVGNERKELARRLALTETQVKVWFQNRRTKAKRMKNEDTAGTPGAASTTSSASSSTAKTTTTTAVSYHQPLDGTIVRSGHESAGDHPEKDTLEISVSNGPKSAEGVDQRPSSGSSVADEQGDAMNEENDEGFRSSDDEESE